MHVLVSMMLWSRLPNSPCQSRSRIILTTGWFWLEFHHQIMSFISLDSMSLNWRLTICTEPSTVLEHSRLLSSVFAYRVMPSSRNWKQAHFGMVPPVGLAPPEPQKDRVGTVHTGQKEHLVRPLRILLNFRLLYVGLKIDHDQREAQQASLEEQKRVKPCL